jgi:phage-related protein (TIGR01555 family)
MKAEIKDVFKLDNWMSAVTGLGSSVRDKLRSLTFQRTSVLNDETLESLFHGDDMAAVAVSALPEESMRQGYRVTIEGEPDQSTELVDQLQEMEANDKILEGMIWGNLYGGGGIFLGANDGQDPVEPLNEENIQTFDFLNVVDKRDMIPHTYYSDPLEPKFGKPKTYLIIPTGVSPAAIADIVSNEHREIHESRLLIFEGVLTSRRRKADNNGWSHSILERAYDPLQQFQSNWLSVSHLMTDASQAVFKVKGLMQMITSGHKELLQTRMELVDMARSVARAVLVDADKEDFERKPTNFSGLADIIDKSMIRWSAAIRTPVTVVMGQSPAGMDATGESDMRLWYDKVKTHQENKLRRQIERIIRLKLLSKDGPTGGVEPDNWGVTFNPLWQPTAKEQAEIRKLTSDADGVDIQNSVLLPEEVTENRFRPEGYSTETIIDLDTRQGVLEEEERTEPTEPPTDEPTEEKVEEVTTPEAVDPGTALNGAQTDKLIQIVLDVSKGAYSKKTGIQLITAAFPLSEADATKILADVEVKEPTPEPTGGPPAPPPPGAPPTPPEPTEPTPEPTELPPTEPTPERTDQGQHTHTFVVNGHVFQTQAASGPGHVHTVQLEREGQDNQEETGGPLTDGGTSHWHTITIGGETVTSSSHP